MITMLKITPAALRMKKGGEDMHCFLDGRGSEGERPREIKIKEL